MKKQLIKQIFCHNLLSRVGYLYCKSSGIVLLFFLVCLTGCDAEELLPEISDISIPTQPEDNACGGDLVAINVSVDGTDDFFGGVQTRETLKNVRFRLIAYKNSISTANYAGTAVFSVDNSGTASVVSGTATPANNAGQLILPPGTYAFVLYCYNSNSNPPTLSNNLTMTVYHNQDFMVCNRTGVAVSLNSTGTFTLGNITFTRLCARLQMAVTAEGFTNNIITSGGATISGLSTTASWTAGQSSLSVSGSSGSLGIGWSSQNSSTVNSYYYPVLPQSSREVSVKFTSLTIDGTSYANKVGAKVTSQKYDVGKDYKITVKVKPNEIVLDGITWAPGNLKSNFTFASKQSDYGDYVGWNTTNFGNGQCNTGSYSKNNDPCQKVSPAGTWVTPSPAQLERLETMKTKEWGTLNGVSGYWFGGVDKGLFLPSAGYRSSGGSTYAVGSLGYYWSNTRSDSSNAYALSFDGGNIGVHGTYYRINGRSVRCVKG